MKKRMTERERKRKGRKGKIRKRDREKGARWERGKKK
jgi:hypothetical protein